MNRPNPTTGFRVMVQLSPNDPAGMFASFWHATEADAQEWIGNWSGTALGLKSRIETGKPGGYVFAYAFDGAALAETLEA